MKKPNIIWSPFPGSQKKFMACPVWECLLHGNRGGGKSQPLHCKVLTPKGWKTIKDMKIGSRICNPDGTTSTVIGIYPQGEIQSFKVSVDGGGVTYCSGDHLWYAKIANKSTPTQIINTPLYFTNGRIFTTEQLINDRKRFPQHTPIIPVPKPIKFTHQKLYKYSFDPYLLGLLLGDGSLNSGRNYRVGFTTIDKELSDYVKRFGFEQFPCEKESIEYHAKSSTDIYKNLSIANLLGTKSHNKFIPKRYLYGSIEERLAVLQGLMDTDGYAPKDGRKATFTSVSKQLASGVRFLVHSLGGRTTFSKYRGKYKKEGKWIKCRIAYDITITFPNNGDIFRLERKKKRCEGKTYQHEYIGRKIHSIVPHKIELCQCIKIDNPNGLYITDDFIVTHNTDVLVMDFLQNVGKGYGSDYKGLLLREATTELGDVISKTKKWIPKIFPNANYNGSKKIWTFPEGEALWLNYARTMDDYDQYHGHEYSIKSDTYVLSSKGNIKAENINVGDLVQTLNGMKKVTKKLSYKKYGVKVSVLDADSDLIGTQHQGLIHPVLTSAGWQRIGLSCLFQNSEQSEVGKSHLKEVSQFLFGVHQEILVASQSNLYLEGFQPIFVNISKWYSCLYQIFHQFLRLIAPEILKKGFHLYEVQENLLACRFEKVLEIFSVEWKHEHPLFLQLLQYCSFLLNLVRQIHLKYVHLLQSILYLGLKQQFSLNVQSFRVFQQCQNEIMNDFVTTSLSERSVLNQIALSEIYAYVQILMHKEQDFQDHCFVYHDLNDELLLQVLKNDQFSFPSQNDALEQSRFLQQKGDQDILLEHSLDRDSPFVYNRPYTNESVYTSFSLDQFFSYGVSSLDSPIKMVDFEIEDEHHYLSSLDTISDDKENVNNKYDTEYNQYHNRLVHNRQQIFLVNQNCWIGWEELTNHIFPTVYLKMMSCNRSSNPKIPLKYRATCNPSGPGHGWVKQRFIDTCKPGKIFREELEFEYPDSNGVMQKQKVSVARTHVQSYMAENKALLEADPMYMAKIFSLTQDNEMLRKAWIDGSWDLLIGGFFTDVWDKKIHVLPNFKIPRSWSLFRGFDWGSSKPWSVTYGLEANGEQPNGADIPYIPKGSVIVATEIYGWNGTPNEGDRATSSEIAARVLDVDNALLTEYGVKCIPGPADTSIYDVRDGVSIGSELSRHGCRWTRAYKGAGSRVAGWSTIRQMLGAAKRQELEAPHLYFFDQAAHHIRTLPQMQRDEKKPEDINCFVAGTMVSTETMDMPIENIKVGDLVKTPIGIRKVKKAGISGFAKVVKITFGQTELIGTADHKIFVEGEGLVPLSKIIEGNVLCPRSLHFLEESNSQASMKDILNAITVIVNFLMEQHYCTEQNGNIILGQFQKDMNCIIKTESNMIAVVKILNYFMAAITQDSTCKRDLLKAGIYTKNLKSGEHLKKVNDNLYLILKSAVKMLPNENLRAITVIKMLSQNIPQKNSVVLNAETKYLEKLKKNVSCAENFFGQNHTIQEKHKLVVTDVDGNYGEAKVYNLTTEQSGMYYANGVLVSNSDLEDHAMDSLRYLVTRKLISMKQRTVRN